MCREKISPKRGELRAALLPCPANGELCPSPVPSAAPCQDSREVEAVSEQEAVSHGQSSLQPGSELRLRLVALTFGFLILELGPRKEGRFPSATLWRLRAEQGERKEICLHSGRRERATGS